VNSIFTPVFPLTLPLFRLRRREGGVRGDFHGPFYATFRLIQPLSALDQKAMTFEVAYDPGQSKWIQ